MVPVGGSVQSKARLAIPACYDEFAGSASVFGKVLSAYTSEVDKAATAIRGGGASTGLLGGGFGGSGGGLKLGNYATSFVNGLEGKSG